MNAKMAVITAMFTLSVKIWLAHFDANAQMALRATEGFVTVILLTIKMIISMMYIYYCTSDNLYKSSYETSPCLSNAISHADATIIDNA